MPKLLGWMSGRGSKLSTSTCMCEFIMTLSFRLSTKKNCICNTVVYDLLRLARYPVLVIGLIGVLFLCLYGYLFFFLMAELSLFFHLSKICINGVRGVLQRLQ